MGTAGPTPYLSLAGSNDSRQPPTLPGVHQQEHDVMAFDELLQLLHIPAGLLQGDAGGVDRVSRHGDAHVEPSGILGKQQREGHLKHTRGHKDTRHLQLDSSLGTTMLPHLCCLCPPPSSPLHLDYPVLLPQGSRGAAETCGCWFQSGRGALAM